MTVRVFVAIAYLAIFVVVCVKSMLDPDSAFVGAALVTFGWVSLQIVREGLSALTGLLTRHFLGKEDSEE